MKKLLFLALPFISSVGLNNYINITNTIEKTTSKPSPKNWFKPDSVGWAGKEKAKIKTTSLDAENWFAQTQPLEFIYEATTDNYGHNLQWINYADNSIDELYEDITTKVQKTYGDPIKKTVRVKAFDFDYFKALIEKTSKSQTINLEIEILNEDESATIIKERKYVRLHFIISSRIAYPSPGHKYEYDNVMTEIKNSINNLGFVLTKPQDNKSIQLYDYENEKIINELEFANIVYNKITKKSGEMIDKINSTRSKISGIVVPNPQLDILKLLHKAEKEKMINDITENLKTYLINLRQTNDHNLPLLTKEWTQFKFIINLLVAHAHDFYITYGDLFTINMIVNLDAEKSIERTAVINPDHDFYPENMQRVKKFNATDEERLAVFRTRKESWDSYYNYNDDLYNSKEFEQITKNAYHQLTYKASPYSQHKFDKLVKNKTFNSFHEIQYGAKQATNHRTDLDLLVKNIESNNNYSYLASEFKQAILDTYNILSNFIDKNTLLKSINSLKLHQGTIPGGALGYVKIESPNENSRVNDYNLDMVIGSDALTSFDEKYPHGKPERADLAPFHVFIHEFGHVVDYTISKQHMKEIHRHNQLSEYILNYQNTKTVLSAINYFAPTYKLDSMPEDQLLILYASLLSESVYSRSSLFEWYAEIFTKWVLTKPENRDKSWEIVNDMMIRSLSAIKQ